SSDNHFSLSLLAAVDRVQNFLLGKAMVIGETLGIDQFAAEMDQALFKTFGLRDAAKRSHFPRFQSFQVQAATGKDVFEIERVVNALDDAGGRVKLRDLAA